MVALSINSQRKNSMGSELIKESRNPGLKLISMPITKKKMFRAILREKSRSTKQKREKKGVLPNRKAKSIEMKKILMKSCCLMDMKKLLWLFQLKKKFLLKNQQQKNSKI